METVTDIVTVLDDHGFLDTDTTTKVEYIFDALTDFLSREPWPFLEAQPATLTFDGISSTPATGMPANFQAAVSLVDPSNGRVIVPERIDNLEKATALSLTTVDDPQWYYFIGTELHFAPIPTAATTLRLRYLQYQTEITVDSVAADILLPTRFWMALVFGALIRLYDEDDDPETSQRFEQHFESRIQVTRQAMWQRQFDRSDAIVITDPDYYPHG